MNSATQASQKPLIYFIDFPQKTEKVYFDVFYRRGHIFDPAEFRGITHIIEHYLIGGIKKNHPADDLEIDGSVTNEFTDFSFTSSNRRLFQDLPKFLQGIFQADFSDHELFDYELSAIKNEINERNNDPQIRAYSKISEHLFPDDCPYNVTDIGDADELKKFNLAKTAHFYHEDFIVSEPMFVLGAYGLAKDDKHKIEKLIGEYSPAFRKPLSSFRFPSCPLSLFRITEVKMEEIKEGIHAIFIFPAFSIQNDDAASRIGLNVLAGIIRGDSPSGIGGKIRRAGIYKIDSENTIGQSMGTASLMFFVENAEQLYSLAEIRKEYLESLRKEEIGVEYAQKLISDIREKDGRIWADNNGRYNWIAGELKDTQKPVDFERWGSSLDKINPD